MIRTHSLAIALSAALLSACGGGSGSDSAPASTSTSNNGTSTSTPTATAPAPAAPSIAAPRTDIAQHSYTNGELAAAYTFLNQLRVDAGSGSLEQSALLDTATQGHSNWLAAQATLPANIHRQISGTAGFTGVTATDRWAAVGYTGRGFELSLPLGLPASGSACIRGLFASPSHAAQLLGADREVGIGIASNTLTACTVAVATTPGTSRQAAPAGTAPAAAAAGVFGGAFVVVPLTNADLMDAVVTDVRVEALSLAAQNGSDLGVTARLFAPADASVSVPASVRRFPHSADSGGEIPGALLHIELFNAPVGTPLTLSLRATANGRPIAIDRVVTVR